MEIALVREEIQMVVHEAVWPRDSPTLIRQPMHAVRKNFLVFIAIVIYSVIFLFSILSSMSMISTSVMP